MAGTKPRRKLRTNDPASTRELILEEAMRLIGRRGVEDLRIRDLADAVGIRKPSVYKHFINRDAIISTLAERMVAEMGRFLKPDPSLSPPAWMEAWARALVWFFATRPAYAILILREIATPAGIEAMESAVGPARGALAHPPLQDLGREFERQFARGVRDGEFKQINRESLTSALYGAVLASVVWPYFGRRPGEFSAAELLQLQDYAVQIFRALARKAGSHA